MANLTGLTPGPSRPLSLTGYAEASLLLAWTFDRASHEAILLFARVELLPLEVPALHTIPLLVPNGGAVPYVWAGLVRLTAQEGLSWYEDALRGEWKVPQPLHDSMGLANPPVRFRSLGPALQEPAWPTLSTLQTIPAHLPFVAQDLGTPRVHHRLTTPAIREAIWSPAVLEKAAPKLLEALHFDLGAFSFLLGSAHLVAANPVLRSASTSLAPRGESGHEDVALELVPRRGQSLSGLTVTLREKRATGRRLLLHEQDPQPITLVAGHGQIGEISMTVDSLAHGPLIDEPAYAFIRQIRIGVALASGRRSVTAAEDETYEVSVTHGQEMSLLGNVVEPGALALFADAERAARAQAAEKRRKQVWFEGGAAAARRELRELVGTAQRQVMLVDYFLSKADLVLLVPAVGNRTVAIRLLTSREGLKAMGGGAPKNARELADAAENMRAQLSMQATQIRVLGGQESPIHDRFLLVDDDLYLMGSSLNSFGSRGTMLVRLPYPVQVIDRLDRYWDAAKPIKEIAEEEA